MTLLNERQSQIASYIIVTVALLILIPLHLLVAFLSGFLVYALLTKLSPYAEKFSSGKYGRIIAVAIFNIVVISILVFLVFGSIAYVVHDLKDGGLVTMSRNLDTLLERFQQEFGQYFSGYIPESLDDMKQYAFEWLKNHVETLQHAGTDALHAFVTMIIGMILGALVSLSPIEDSENVPSFKHQCLQRLNVLYTAFKNVVFAQIKISIVNTVLAGIFILAVLPLLGMHLPFAKTLVILTFIFGLIPVVGNLISNTLVILSAISISFTAATIAFIYLVSIHKLEYFLNAKIIGQRINANAWELLIAMLFFQAVFGLAGLIVAPIYYSYFKNEMKQAGLI
ncbi:AI-2E family transporter [Acinetobacter ursingii]|uniref:AI-2E family transporter n=1 Tax=Acinetobacter ursingii TaxID=108980 RepID=UPI00249CAAE1|nr:AI-2E family transporter [Acinetobacter ursingii]MDI3238004.1 AI-2E family transporter [Acinetobacter ursingii]